MIKNLPSWYYNPESRVAKGEIAFIGDGSSAESSRQAELVAYSNLFEKLEDYVGTEIGRESYRDLINTGSIESLGVHIILTDRSYSEKRDVYRVLILCGASEEIMTSLRTESREEEYNREKEAVALVDEADQCIKDSKDLRAVQLYLQSMILSHDLDGIEEGYDYQSILKEVKQILSTLSLKVVSSNTSEASCSVCVERRETILKTKVDMAEIRASYICLDGLGNTWEDSYSFTSNSDGVFQFRSVNYTLAAVGDIVFTFDIYSEIEQIRSFDSETADVLSSLVEEKKIAFSYDKNLNRPTTGIQVLAYNEKWNLEKDNPWAVYLQNRLSSDSIASYAASYTEEADLNSDGDLTDSEILSSFSRMTERDIKNALILRMGVLEQRKTEAGIWHVVVESEATYYTEINNSAGNVSPVLNVSGFGSSYEEALENAYKNICNIIYDWLKGNYV